MIFVTVGSQKFQFNRLLKKIDSLIEDEIIKDEVFAQIGFSDYKPKKYKYTDFMTQEKFNEKLDECDLLITHAGTGVIVNAVKKGKKVIAIPRLAEYGEHVDNHQIQLIEQFKELNLICACEDMNIEKALKTVNEKTYDKYKSNTENIIKSIEDFIEGKKYD